MAARRRIAFATRELHPFAGGGIAPITAALARELAPVAEVELFTSARYREAHERSPGEYGEGVRIHFVDEPDGAVDFYTAGHSWSARLYEALAARYAAAGGPDLIEFVDYLAEGFVTIQARHTHEPWLERTRVAVRLQTTAELCSVLDGSLAGDFETESVLEAERYCLRRADALLVPGGDILGTYRRYYGAERLAPAVHAPDAFLAQFAAAATPARTDGPLRVLFLGRLERRKGVHDLVRAALDTEGDWRLSLLGADTATGPLGVSVRGQLELMAAGDDRIAFLDAVPREQVGALIADHDVVVVPSLWECWPNVVREAFHFDRPVLATPVGGLVEMVEPGRSGWLTSGTGDRPLRERLQELIDEPGRARALAAAGGPGAALASLADGDRTRAAYDALLGAAPPALRRRTPRREQVSVVVPYFRMDAHVEETVRSIAAQTVAPAQVVVVNDGSFREQDAVLERLAGEHDLTIVAQPNAGLSAARNLGVACSLGDLVLPLDPDNVLEPEFVERCLHALRRDDSLAYVTTWASAIGEDGRSLGRDRGLAPYGNWSALIDRNNVGGDGTALIRRRWFDAGFAYSVDLTSFEDWFLYRQLHHAGRCGAVIPRRLFRYRVRDDSMVRTIGHKHTVRIFDEMNAHLREARTPWTPAIG